MKRTLRTIFGMLLLALAIAVTQIPVEMSEAASDSSDFQLDGTKLIKYTGTAYAVSVPNEVKIIGEEAFSGNSTVKLVYLPDGLETIEYGAFSYCNVLNKISIPDSVESIGSGAFACCGSLTTVEIGSGVKTMGNGVFAGCDSLKNISLDKGNSSFIMKKGALYDYEQTKLYQYCPGRKDLEYTLPDSVTDIGRYAFWGCNNLERVNLNNNISAIPAYAFSNCRALVEMELPYSLSTIDAKAFEDCISLSKMDLPVSLRNIHSTAFDGCINLTLTGPEGSIAGEYAEKFNKREKTEQAEYEDIFQSTNPADDDKYEQDGIYEDVTEEQDNTSENTDNGNMLGTTAIVGNQAFVFIDNSQSKVYVGDNSVSGGDEQVTVNGPKDPTDELISEDNRNDGKGIHIPKYTLFNGVIADQAYYKNKNMTSYTIPGNITEIGDFAFARSGLTSINIPEGVTKIGYGAFYHCDNLNQITLPSTISKIEPEAFSKTGFVENWKKSGSSDFLTLGNGILVAYNGDDSTVNIPEGVRIIAPGVFANRPLITTVVLPDSLEIIGEGAFEGCSRLKQVSGGLNVKKIEDRAFAGAPLDTIRIQDNVENLGLRAFDMSEINKRTDQKVAVFNKNIPALTYEDTATRLSNDEYIGMALSGVCYAVIDEKVNADNLKETVLDGSVYGFKGIIVSIDSKADMTAYVRATTLTTEELKDFKISQTIEIFGRQYTLSGIEQLENLALDNAKNTYNNTGKLRIVNNANDLETGNIYAELSENKGDYYLSINQSDSAYERLSKAFYDIYDINPPTNFVAYDISLYEAESNVPITKLGRRKVEITLPLPEGLQSGTLFVLTADSNGQLEDVPYWYEENENGRKITFEVNHFSDFGLYTSGTTLYAEGVTSQGKAVIDSYSVKDDSPNTGDMIHPKWFLAGGLFFTAMAVFFLKKKSRRLF